MTNPPSVEHRLAHARGIAAVLARLAAHASRGGNDAPPPAFWRGLGDMADAIEDDLAALQKALAVLGEVAEAKRAEFEALGWAL